MVHIGTDSDEIWKGWTHLWQDTRKQFKRLQYYKARIHDLTVNFSTSGDTAWYFHLLDDRIKSKGSSETVCKGTRFTSVLHKISDV